MTKLKWDMLDAPLIYKFFVGIFLFIWHFLTKFGLPYLSATLAGME